MAELIFLLSFLVAVIYTSAVLWQVTAMRHGHPWGAGAASLYALLALHPKTPSGVQLLFLLLVLWFTRGGGRWLRKKLASARASLTSIGEQAFRRDLARAR